VIVRFFHGILRRTAPQNDSIATQGLPHNCDKAILGVINRKTDRNHTKIIGGKLKIKNTAQKTTIQAKIQKALFYTKKN